MSLLAPFAIVLYLLPYLQPPYPNHLSRVRIWESCNNICSNKTLAA